MGNTPENPKLAVFGLRVATCEDPNALGPVRAKAFVPQAGRKPKHEGIGALASRTLWSMMAHRINGKWRASPFFGADGPIQSPHVFTKDERDALFSRLDPQSADNHPT